MELNSNMPFVTKSFQKAVSKTVEHGKVEIEAFAANTVRRHGLETLEGMPKLITQDNDITITVNPDID